MALAPASKSYQVSPMRIWRGGVFGWFGDMPER
jgi:hypothetical protein